MTITTFSLFLAGLAATAVPIVLHLLSRGKPKKVVFPALRFARQKFAENKRKLTLKRLLLLALRVGTLVLLGLTLARPVFLPPDAATFLDEARQNGEVSEVGENSEDAQTTQINETDAIGQDGETASAPRRPEKAGIAGRNAPVAAAIVVDSSVRTGRVKNNESFFETARATAAAIVAQLPPDSEIAILDGTFDGDAFQPDRFAARTRLEKLEIEPGGRPVAETTLEALRLVERSTLPTKEIFVLSDGTRPGWSASDAARLRRQYAATVQAARRKTGAAASKENAASADADDAELPGVPRFYFVDLGDDAFQNVSVGSLSLSAETLAAGGTLRIDVDVERVGPGERDATLELVLFDAQKLPSNLEVNAPFDDETLVLRRESQTLSFADGRSKRSAVFQPSDLPPGACVGAVRVVGADALAADDVRWFAVDVETDWRLLVVAPNPVADKSLFLTQALAPEEFKKTGRAPFELDVVPFAAPSTAPTAARAANAAETQAPTSLATATPETLARYRAVLLLDPPASAFDEATVRRLTAFVEKGGGLGVFLGRNATPISAFQTETAVRLLGAKPVDQARVADWNRALKPANYDAPLLAPFRPFERAGVPWDALPVGRFWRLTDLTPTATVVARFEKIDDAASSEETGETGENAQVAQVAQNKENGAKSQNNENSEKSETAPPALVENRLGRGTVATLATPLSDGTQNDAWNDLTVGDAPWVFVLLADGIARRLASGDASILNYSVGETATLRSPLETFPAVATLTTPQGEELAIPTDVERRQIRFPGTSRAGLYRLRTAPNADGETLEKAFAVSIPDAEFDLTRPTPDDWAALWDGVPYKTLDLTAASTALEAIRSDKTPEPYALLVVALAVLFLAETAVANRFYRR
ncbi:MAG: BatA domain-containing protein [Thermoguttaceae bacterium]|nr:BatA domain-containing protein [Thermoguttaceae bacterium]